ncbi:sugar ABC transporter ATP-binding protein [Mesorhizobium sp. M2A.F.Ca.ET.037.01.1.1]|uniref:sugar ABC transporter ATP-binding protein n=2 Tax=unclassified Mesorhizobium TaxID=325217 RepID=UPI000FC9CFCB|nr:sugar ABC transporter ATP-binding protein [Mesorhizobium sp. M2A.F.Ca.ET.037.01.1.1]RUX19668.1 sugar ABC transporter ATP-binding protein [Mesorhizobium sp. M2A.F.Ca.ET.037.01.1.1]RUY13185.1 sugar ABC transporter ATP-binding protein [Mesorhizobium sp. M2A.F.Ca.ET.040.01.1.1]RWA91571.1 MAG: sugar ABC transporter ATP-binding protein [Mesorhizobium sp.]TIV15499.1 MAG: ATP-binding cassette domain-containing protein [Mesorhizobium sp.]
MEFKQMSVPAISLLDVSKSFGHVVALQPVSLDIAAGTIHAFVGQNGAGKSTTLGVLAGRIEPSSGRVLLFGEEANLGNPRAARAQGVSAIYQELTIVPALSAAANVFLGQTLAHGGFLDERAMHRRFSDLCARLGVSIDPAREARRLSVADQQMLEIMRALQADSKIILFDEPTTALAPPERDALFNVMRELRDQGHTLIYVSHNLDEVLGISEQISVFRNGRLVQTQPRASWTKQGLVASMLGEAMGDIYHRRNRTLASVGSPVLKVRGLTVPGAVTDLALSVSAGEILGIGGLVGAGRTTFLRAIAGMEPRARGKFVIAGREVAWPTDPRTARDYGIALVPEDRKTQGLVLGMSSMDNVAMANYGRVRKSGFVDAARLRSLSRKSTDRFGLDPRRLGDPVGNLSGGNQQKVLLSRWDYEQPKVLMVDEPTRGIDVGAKSEILDALRDFAERGTAVIIVSSELEEIVAVADRVVVLSEGRLVDELDHARSPLSVHAILNSAFGVEGSRHAQH